MEETNLNLKFRMWNENLKEMTYFDNPHFVFHKNSEKFRDFEALFAFSIAENSALYFGTYKIIMQSIGLLDKNDKLAYEDDIIEFNNTEGTMFRKIIKWDERYLCWMIGNIPYFDLFNSSYIQPSKLVFEIIGNIHENLDLVEKEYLGDIEKCQ